MGIFYVIGCVKIILRIEQIIILRGPISQFSQKKKQYQFVQSFFWIIFMLVLMWHHHLIIRAPKGYSATDANISYALSKKV